MIDIKLWMGRFTELLKETFGERIYFVGLQGSYARGEATEASDIDVVVILDKLTADDIKKYSDMVDILPNRELICGFLSGKDELINWEPSDLFQFYYDTIPIAGTLDELLTKIDKEAVDRAIKIGACNIYHGCVHNMLYEKSDDIVRGLYKSASFVIQALVFKDTGKYVRHQKDLLEAVNNEEKEIVNNYIALKNGATVKFDAMSVDLFNWVKKLIKI
ncbi:nucleotidyltransferase domain-containing protein [Acetivibrio mesophilus]|uniref:Nucleotidyltransferase domain-containing protein n=1 Tax=Acetivibrio mesophilus TaxID=2487273 RepID=A0A4Q0I830_9FIRM|nr:nucleotidyltransferase domain-containing protein [Acetivibrio mesophilus]ODM26356.1 nucleotidyltransferase [Clostridium sp. Bc-iso-3]RXE60584.1 nucleotidyltransferase domain-containing protein [Acetivibrio mesophilus]HHV30350.1 nucleotidyltransferase domain-containing protein [Clostridium sp.]